ncbi:MAG: DHA2 family efflux MFS transporter permease subunit [Peptococcaceae bacterium]|nr:MAG: DHA2 family efflux MFS transporter permease subunit [Peptococcaceae bacterium]
MFSRWEKILILTTLVIGLSMDLLDMTIVNVAISKLMHVFNADVNKIQWVVTAYMMTIGIIIPITAYLADTFGIKKIFIASMILFTAGSALCGLAWSLNTLIIFRIIQGIGGGMIMPLGISIVYKIFPEEKRGLAMGIIGLPLFVAPAIGPVLGGYIVEYTDWRLIFLINIPVGILAILLSAIVLKEFEKYHLKLDFVGFIFSAVGLGSLLLALSNGPTEGWDTPYVVYLLVTSGFLLTLFILWELNHPQPLLELRLFSNFAFCSSMLLTVFSIMAIMGSLFLIPVFLQNLKWYGPLKTGLLLLPEALSAALIMPVSGLLVNKLRPVAFSVPAVTLVTYATFALTKLELQSSDTNLIWLLIILGIGLGLGMVPIMTVGLNAAPPRLTGQATSLLNIVRQVGSSFSIAILATVIQTRQEIHYARVADSVNILSPVTGGFLNWSAGYLQSQGLTGQEANLATVSLLYLQARLEGAILAFHDAFGIAAFFGALALIPALAYWKIKVSNSKLQNHGL